MLTDWTSTRVNDVLIIDLIPNNYYFNILIAYLLNDVISCLY